MGQRYPRMKDQTSGPGLACNLDFLLKKKDLNQRLKSVRNCLSLEICEQTCFTQTYHRRWSGG